MNFRCFWKELFVFTGSQRWIHFASVPPPSASSNEWVPVFRAQAAAMNKMAFKAFFITAFSQTERDSCRASDGCRLGRLDFFDFPHRKNVQNVFILKTFSSWCDSWWIHICAPQIQDNMVGILTVNLNTGKHGNYDTFFKNVKTRLIDISWH